MLGGTEDPISGTTHIAVMIPVAAIAAADLSSSTWLRKET